MSIYAISDLHLSFAKPKPMDVFGEIWHDHTKRVAENWDKTVRKSDAVLIAGDTSWALRYEDALPDIQWLHERPGMKILVRGNHDYWWKREATNRIRKDMPDDIKLLQGNSILIGNTAITGTRGWRLEDNTELENDHKVLKRELMYFERGAESLPVDATKKIAVLHYPPFDANLELNDFAIVIDSYEIDIVLYGHIHTGPYLEGKIGRSEYKLVSADHINMKPQLIIEETT